LPGIVRRWRKSRSKVTAPFWISIPRRRSKPRADRRVSQRLERDEFRSRRRTTSPSPRSSRGEGWGEGPVSANSEHRCVRRLPLTRIAPDEAEPVIGRAFARPVGIAEAIRPLPASGPQADRKRGEVSGSHALIQLNPHHALGYLS